MKSFLNSNLRSLWALCFLFLASVAANAQQNALVEPNQESQWQALPNAGGGIITVASSNSFTPNFSVQLSNFNAALNLNAPASSVISLPNFDLDVRDISVAPAMANLQGGHYVCGVATPIGGGIPQMFVLRTMTLAGGPAGIAWIQLRPFALNEIGAEAVSVVTLPNGGVAVVGNVTAPIVLGPVSTNVYVAQFTGGGAFVWGNTYNCSCGVISSPTTPNNAPCRLEAREAIHDVTTGGGAATNMGSIAITGRYTYSTTVALNTNDAFVLNVDANTGAEVYRNIYPFGMNNQFKTEGYDIVQNLGTGGNLGIVGRVENAQNGVSNTYFFEITPNGAIICNRQIAIMGTNGTMTPTYGRAIALSNQQGNYVIAGVDLGSANSYMMELMGSMVGGICGQPVWHSRFSTTTPTAASESIVTHPNGYYLTSSAQMANDDIWVGNVDNMGNDLFACPVAHEQFISATDPHMVNLLHCQKAQPAWAQMQGFVMPIQAHEKYCPASSPCNVGVTINGPVTCTSTSATLSAVVSGGTAPFTYSWSPGGANTPSITVTTDGSYAVVVTDANGCTATASFNVCLAFTATLNGPSTGCGAVSLTAGPGGQSYQWSLNGSPLPNTTQTISATASGNYCVTVTKACGCTSVACKQVTIKPKAVGMISPTNVTICNGQCVTLTALPASGVTYQWSTGATTQSITVCPTISTTYNVTLTNCYGCKTVLSRKVNVINCTTTPGAGCFTSPQAEQRTEVTETIVIQKDGQIKINDNSSVGDDEGNLDRTFDAEENMTTGEFAVFPNPTKGGFTVDFAAHLEQAESLKLYDINGKILRDLDLSSSGKTEVDISSMPVGVYYLILKTEEGSLAKKVVLVRDK